MLYKFSTIKKKEKKKQWPQKEKKKKAWWLMCHFPTHNPQLLFVVEFSNIQHIFAYICISN